jgi:hypothetical protein
LKSSFLSEIFERGLVEGNKDCFFKKLQYLRIIFFRIHEATGIDMSSDVYEMLGYDEREKKVRLGVLAENTHTQIKDKLSQLLKSHPEVCITNFFDIYSLN